MFYNKLKRKNNHHHHHHFIQPSRSRSNINSIVDSVGAFLASPVVIILLYFCHLALARFSYFLFPINLSHQTLFVCISSFLPPRYPSPSSALIVYNVFVLIVSVCLLYVFY